MNNHISSEKKLFTYFEITDAHFNFIYMYLGSILNVNKKKVFT